MNRPQQKHFVSELSVRIAMEICDKIDNGLIPENWDGHELRALLCMKHKESAEMSVINREHRSRRARSFRNEVLVSNL